MKMKVLLPVFVAGLIMASCQKDEMPKENSAKQIEQEKTVSDELLEKVSNIYMNANHVEYFDLLLPDGSVKEDQLLIGGDIAMSPEQLDALQPAPHGEGENRQYHTYNLVNNNQTIYVIGYTGSNSQGLTNKQQTALSWAIANYNAQNIGLNFSLSFGTNYYYYDIVVYQNPNGQAGGVAGFPSGGDPYKWVQIYSGMNNYSTNTNEHVMVHEIGHTLGLRHTDWATRQSCGQSGESANPSGAVHIPGTPTGYDATSVMLACFSASEDGEFGYYDEVALNYLY